MPSVTSMVLELSPDLRYTAKSVELPGVAEGRTSKRDTPSVIGGLPAAS
jgi:hypothetical protein